MNRHTSHYEGFFILGVGGRAVEATYGLHLLFMLGSLM